MSMHKIPLTPIEEAGLRAHGLAIGKPSQLSDAFRQGVRYASDQLLSQGGEAVEVVAVAFITRAEKSGPKIAITLKKEDAEKQHKNWLSMSKIITTEPLMTVAQHQRILAADTHPADQVADDLTMVKVPRELLEEIVELHRRRGVVLIIHVEQLAELLEVKP